MGPQPAGAAARTLLGGRWHWVEALDLSAQVGKGRLNAFPDVAEELSSVRVASGKRVGRVGV